MLADSIRRECENWTIKTEGGFVDDPRDPGGATNHGITLATLQHWRKPEPVTVADVRDLTEDEAREIYRAEYWHAARCDRMPAGVAMMVFDFGVTSGVGRSARLLQRILAVEEDGDIGPETLATLQQVVSAKGQDHLIIKLEADQETYYRSLGMPEFLDGWLARTERRADFAQDLAA